MRMAIRRLLKLNLKIKIKKRTKTSSKVNKIKTLKSLIKMKFSQKLVVMDNKKR